VDQLQQLHDPLADLRLRALADLQAEGHVAVHGHVLERRVVLEDEADVATLRGQPGRVDAGDDDLPASGFPGRR